MKIIDDILYKYCYIKKSDIRFKIKTIMDDIMKEILSRPEHPNIGKKGCWRRLDQLLDCLK